MDEKTAAQLKQKLLDEKASLEAQLGEIAKKNPAIKGDWTSVPPDIADPADSMDEKAQSVTTLEERRAIEHNLELRLKEIDETLERLSQGVYGVCVRCKQTIAERRLEAVAIAKLCFDCANKATLS